MMPEPRLEPDQPPVRDTFEPIEPRCYCGLTLNRDGTCALHPPVRPLTVVEFDRRDRDWITSDGCHRHARADADG